MSLNDYISSLFCVHFPGKTKKVKAVLVKLDNPSMGEATRRKYADLSPKVRDGATPIFIVTREFPKQNQRRKNHYVTYKITGFPLRCAEASTAHKFQGITVEEDQDIVLHGFKPMPAGMAYVMLSRAKSINSVYLDKSFVTNKFKFSESALKEKEALDLRYELSVFIIIWMKLNLLIIVYFILGASQAL